MKNTEAATTAPVVIVPMGTHLLALLKHNPRQVVAAIDYRNNGALEKAGIDALTHTIHKIGTEQSRPLLSIANNRAYYERVAMLIKNLIAQHPNCRFILTANYTPITRFIIDHAGPERVELWEDGLNHYLRMESMLKRYRLKEWAKWAAGFYRSGLFDTNYRGEQLQVRDRFRHHNLHYPVTALKSGKLVYIGQPLIEDALINEAHYRQKLRDYFKDQPVNYLPHPREQKRPWLSDIFEVIQTHHSAEQYLSEQGASGLFSAFSTVNVNVQCPQNIFLARYLGMQPIAKKLAKLDFDVQLA